MDTIYLTPSWGMTLDASGNIAMATGEYAIAQDVASACRLFAGELFYDTTKGVPYQTVILGKKPPRAMVSHYLEKAALTVPEVVSAQVTSLTLTARTLTGSIEVIDLAGKKIGVTF